MNLRRHKKSSPVIPIVALVDIFVIVLLFVVATTTFKDAQQQKRAQLNLQLPQSDSLGEATANTTSRSTLTITPDKKIYLDGASIDTQHLGISLKELKLAKPDTQLQLEADQETPLGMLVKIWDELKAAGYELDDIPTSLQRPASQPAP